VRKTSKGKEQWRAFHVSLDCGLGTCIRRTLTETKQRFRLCEEGARENLRSSREWERGAANIIVVQRGTRGRQLDMDHKDPRGMRVEATMIKEEDTVTEARLDYISRDLGTENLSLYHLTQGGLLFFFTRKKCRTRKTPAS